MMSVPLFYHEHGRCSGAASGAASVHCGLKCGLVSWSFDFDSFVV